MVSCVRYQPGKIDLISFLPSSFSSAISASIGMTSVDRFLLLGGRGKGGGGRNERARKGEEGRGGWKERDWGRKGKREEETRGGNSAAE